MTENSMENISKKNRVKLVENNVLFLILRKRHIFILVFEFSAATQQYQVFFLVE